MMAPPTENLIALQKTGINTEYLGNLLWYSIPEVQITREDLEAEFAAAGLDPQHLPRELNHRDAFRRATTSVEAKRQPTGIEGQYLNLLVREVKSDRQTMVRQMVREIVDQNNRRLSYDPVVEFELENERMSWRPLGGYLSLSETEEKAAETAAKQYEIERTHYNGGHMRDALAKILSTCSPVAVRPSGGVYFTPRKHEGTVEALQRFVRALRNHRGPHNGGQPQMCTIPVIDGSDQREMLAESLEDQVKAECKSLLIEMAGVLKAVTQEGRQMKATTAAAYVERVRSLGKMVREYEELLEGEVVAVKSSLEVALKQATELLGKVEA